MSVPGLCAKYGHNRMVKIGALAPAFANATLFFSQVADKSPWISIPMATFGFLTGGVIGMASFTATMVAHDKMDKLVSNRSMSMTRKVRLVRRGQVAVFSLAAMGMVGGLNGFIYGARQDPLLSGAPPEQHTTHHISQKHP